MIIHQLKEVKEISTHGVFVLKDGGKIWGFHALNSGNCIKDFYNKYKNVIDILDLFLEACEFFSSDNYEDHSDLNFYCEEFDENEDYSHITSFTLYYNGEKWYSNFELED